MSENPLSGLLSQELLKAARIVEKNVDEEIDKLQGLSSLTSEKFNEEIDKLRAQRLEALKNEAADRRQFLMKGHGVYEELASEKDFFACTKSSDRIVIHFYVDSNEKCKIVDAILKQVCTRHLEARFVKLNLNSCKFLRDSLKISVPTIILIKDQLVKGRITNFDNFNDISYNTIMLLEVRLGKFGVIRCDEDINEAALLKSGTRKTVNRHTKTIRGNDYDNSDSD